MNKLLILITLFITVSYVKAIPQFNTVNGYYHNGTQCPSLVKKGVPCPSLCVSDLRLCPLPACPLKICGDGSCQNDCSTIPPSSTCSCPAKPGVVLYKCPVSTTINIPNWDASINDLQIYTICSQKYNSSSVYPTWNTLSDSNNITWDVCNSPNGIEFPIKAPFVITYLTIYIAYFVILALWLFYKSFKEKPVDDTILESIILDSKSNEALSTNDIKLKGFTNDWLGLIMVFYTGIVSLAWLILLLVICLDYYGYINNTPYILTYQTYDLSSKAFCVLWFLSTSWYLVLNLVRGKVINFFRLRTTLEEAHYIQIESPRTVIQMLQDNNNDITNTSKSILSNIIKILQQFEKNVRSLLGFDVFVNTVRIKTFSTNQRRYFEYQSKRYIFKDDNFYPASIQLGNNVSQLLSYDGGLTSKEAENRLELIGPNFIAVHVPNFLHALWQELTGFFYIYQLQILWVYFYLDYWQIGLSDTCVILLAAIIKVVIRIRSETRIKKMAEHENDVNVLRDGTWQKLSTSDLVPGDVYEVVSQQIVPVDAVILRGDIVADESSLTGEPLPVRKFPLRDDNLPYDRNNSGKINTLFSGTTIKQAHSAIALILETRSNTEKGKLIQRILFPQEVSFIFHEQLKLVFVILLCYAIFMLGIGIWWNNNPNARMTAYFFALTLVAQILNPILPAMLVVGQSIASSRLRRKGVYCVDLPRILMAGKVQVFCFDKTGTLTKEGLEYYGVYPVSKVQLEKDNDVLSFDEAKQNYDDLKDDNQVHQLLKWGLSTCHSVTTLDDKLVGNFVDVVMVEATGATISTGEGEHDIVTINNNHEKKEQLEIIQRFEFQHSRASMSVVVRHQQTGHVYIFCKGAFERIKYISNGKLPHNFDQVTSNLAREGCYVLGMAYRDLGVIDTSIVLGWTRDELESNLSFFGLVLFKNLLKEDTKDAITELKKGDTRTVMITGDNALTGIFIGKQCGLLPPVRVLIGDVINENSIHHKKYEEEEEEEEESLIKQQQSQLHSHHHHHNIVWKDAETGTIEPDLDLALKTNQIELAITGKAFRQLVKNDQMRKYLFNTRIFARMTPIDKMECVELFMERGITAMCGDGGNDCGALRTAHVGLAMSEAEASIVSPFSTSTRSIQSCVDLLRHGRAGLATSFASYRYLIMYGQTMVTVKFCTFYYTMSFSQWNFILIDAFITLFCSFAVTQSGAAKKLSDRRPTARILSAEVLLSVIGQLFINAWFLIGAYIWLYTRDDFFRCNEWNAKALAFNDWRSLSNSFEADILTFITLYQFINSGFVFNYGYIYRKAWYRNYLLLFVWALFVAIISYWELADPNPFGCLMKVNCGDPDVLVDLGYPRPNFYIQPYNTPLGHNVLPRAFRYQLWAYSIGNFLLINIWELFILYGPVRSYYRAKYSSRKSKIPL